MFSFIPDTLTPNEMEKLPAERLKVLRLLAGYKRTTLALRAGVTVASLKRFETSGQISLKNLLCLAHAVDRLPEFSELFVPPQAASMAQLREQDREKTPQRGRI